MTEPLVIPATLVTPSAKGERGSAALAVELDSVRALVETRVALMRLLGAIPPDLISIQSLFREWGSAARISVIPLDAAGRVAFVSRRPQDSVVLIVAPRPDDVCLAVDPRRPPDLLCLALLHGLGH